jgi:hypothetical protein
MDVAFSPTIQSDNSSNVSSVVPGGCLKLVTQAQSLEQAYGFHSNTQSDRKLSFGSVQVHSHAVQLGDNPSISSGPPLTISWKSYATDETSLDEYELYKPLPREKQEMVLPRHVREAWLRQAGYSRGEVNERVNQIKKIKSSRMKSSRDCDSLVRSVLRAVGRV